MHMIDVKGVPVPAIIKGFLDAMSKHKAETWLIYKQGASGAVASNQPTAETMARSHLVVQDGAIEVAAIALHVYRMAPTTAEPESVDSPTGLCSIVLCAAHELSAGDGKPQSWDDLPEAVREAHRLVAKAAIAAAVAHQPKRDEASRIIKPA
jgi:hypothetical protein